MKKEIMNSFNIKWLAADSKQGFLLLDCLNREIKPHHVSTMAMSIEKMGLIRPVVVAELSYKGKKGLYIVDGQHLYFALLRLNMPIPYVTITINNDMELVEKLALVNNSSKAWTLIDYIQAWSYIQPTYKTLIKHFNVYDLELSIIALILHGRSENISRVLKTGKFKVNNEEKSIKLMDYTTDLLKIVPRLDRASNRRLVNSYIMFVNDKYDTYDHKKFISYLKKNMARLEFINASDDDLTIFYSQGI